jgi:hypothetical protein
LHTTTGHTQPSLSAAAAAKRAPNSTGIVALCLSRSWAAIRRRSSSMERGTLAS